MNQHVQDHCDLPRKVKKWHVNALWLCTCGKLWTPIRVLGYEGSYLQWQQTDLIAPLKDKTKE